MTARVQTLLSTWLPDSLVDRIIAAADDIEIITPEEFAPLILKDELADVWQRLRDCVFCLG